MSVGTYLRQAREAAGYTIEEISAQTRIRPSVIKDLEEENFTSSGGNAYARGHIRSIAKCINLNVEELLKIFEDQTGSNNRSMIELLEENNATVLRNKANFKFSPKIVTTAASVIVGIAIIIPTGLALATKVTHKSPASKPLSQSMKSAKSSEGSAASETTPVVAHGVVITASHGTSWLSVVDTFGTQLFSGKLSNGSSQTFDPTNGLSMTIGNAGAISVSVNGKDQGAIGALGEVKSLTFAPTQTNG